MTQAGRHDLLLLDSDILFADRILDLLLDHPSRDALVMRTSGVLGDEEIKVERDARGCIRRIGKEIGAASAAGESIGMEKFSASTAARLHDILGERKERNEFYEASFQQLIEAGVCVTGVDAGEVPCMEIDTPEDYAVARGIADALDQRIKTSR